MSRGQPGAGGKAWKGHKAALPAKPCATCGREMVWRKRWAATWEQVRHCSDACRRAARGRGAAAPTGEPDA